MAQTDTNTPQNQGADPGKLEEKKYEENYARLEKEVPGKVAKALNDKFKIEPKMSAADLSDMMEEINNAGDPRDGINVLAEKLTKKYDKDGSKIDPQSLRKIMEDHGLGTDGKSAFPEFRPSTEDLYKDENGKINVDKKALDEYWKKQDEQIDRNLKKKTEASPSEHGKLALLAAGFEVPVWAGKVGQGIDPLGQADGHRIAAADGFEKNQRSV